MATLPAGTDHTQVLLTVARNPDIPTRETAEAVGITERAAERIVADLTESGYVEAPASDAATTTRSTAR